MFYRLADPLWLALLALVPVLAFWYWKRGSRRRAALAYSNVTLVKPAVRSRSARWRHVPTGLRLLALSAFVVAFARPQTGVTGENILTEGLDIVLVLDISSSMLAEDLQPNRVEAAKAVAAQFVEGRRNDRIGLVVFAGEAFTQVPLTLDYSVVTDLLGDLEVGLIEDGTAIGMGIATAVKRLQDSRATSKVVVALTDGENNRGAIDPITAAEAARSLGIRLYTIGVGTQGEAPYPVQQFGQTRYVPVPVTLDEDMLTRAAEETGGRYYRATDTESLERIYAEIDELEKTEIEVEEFTRYGELFHIPLLIGLGLVILEVGLAHSALRTLP